MSDKSNPLDDWSDFESALFSEPVAAQGQGVQQQHQQQVQSAQAGMTPQDIQREIEAKQSEVNILNDRFKDVDTHYVIQDGDRYVRDTAKMERDRIRREELRDDIMNLRMEMQTAQARTQDYLGRFKQAAANYARGNSAFVRSRLPAGLHGAFKKRFNEHLNTYYQQGTFSNPAYQSDAMIQGVVESAFNLAFGEVMRQAEAKQAAAERGVESPEGAVDSSGGEEWREDPLAARILERGRRSRGQTVGDVMRAERMKQEQGNG